ncbi:MAG TPA: transglutaminase-like domain-containing protein [Terrimicrobiaceae bacterium]|nr:transglutaminase-like domain-containing protein [Terrimicrobiaceae bacterium]
MFAQREAIVKLLRDDDPETVRMVKEQLILAGEDGIPQLRDLARMDDESVSRHARDVLAEIASRNADDEFLLLCHFFCDDNDLERACWMLAHTLDPSCDIEAYEHKVNQWGRQFLVKISGIVSNRERVRALAEFLAEDLCFRGNTDDYYCERNSLLPSVIETRMGIPIALTILYRMIACRAGMRVDGINLPGHFIARHGEVLFDPFHKGRILTRSDCEEILIRQNLKLRGAHLEAATPRQILLRVLANLLYVYDLRKDASRHARVNTWIKALSRER